MINRMNNFLNITTVFNDYEDRTINKLTTVYTNINKLKDIIANNIIAQLTETNIKGKKVLIKPNWVNHSRSIIDEICLRTNDNFLLAILEIILTKKPSAIIIGDAPIQGCKWDKVVTESLLTEIKKLNNKYTVPIQVIDFRRRTYNISDNNPESDLKPLSNYLIFDIGRESLLEPITTPGPIKFRVTNYDPDRMSSAHSQGVHKYCIAKEFFDADIVISLPKIKTHQKTGITGAVKNLVGINGDKDFLPHHRIGGTKMGGDCYPGRSKLRYWSELLLDYANRKQGKLSFWFGQKLSSLLWKISFPGPEYNLAAGWYGNDTTWRMVMDIIKIAEYGNANGKLSDNPQRQIFSLCDGIIAGQGDGPLKPDPLPLGIISFTNVSFINDRAMALLMGFPIEKIPLLNNSTLNNNRNCEIILNGKRIKIDDLKQYSIKASSPKSWATYFNGIK